VDHRGVVAGRARPLAITIGLITAPAEVLAVI